MDSLSRETLIHNVAFRRFYPTRTVSSSSPSNLLVSSNPQARIRVSISSSFNPEVEKNPIIRKIKSTTGALILTAASVLMMGTFSKFPARAEDLVAVVEEEVEEQENEEQGKEKEPERTNDFPLLQLLESNSEANEALKSLLHQKIESGEIREAFAILKCVVSAEASEIECKFLMAKLLTEIGNRAEARNILDEILDVNPLNFEALLHKSLNMVQCGEGQIALQRLGEILKLVREEQNEKQTRDIRLIIAQIQFLQMNIDEALTIYKELSQEDPNDFRPCFCQGVIYSLLNRISEANEQFTKCCESSPAKFLVEKFDHDLLAKTIIFSRDSDS